MYKFLCVVWLLLLGMSSTGVVAKTNLKIVTCNVRWDSGKDGAHNWVYRRGYLVEYINRLKADIVCMQEVMNNQHEYFTETMPRYGFVGVGCKDGKRSGEFESIFYNKKKFKLIDHGHFWLSETPNSVGSLGWGAKHPHMVTWIKLRTSNNKSFCVLNTHFDWDSNTVRKKSAQLVLKWIEENLDKTPIILAGDFNNDPESETYKTITKSGIVNDSYTIASKREGVGYSFHDFGRLPDNKRKIIDYIFVSNDIVVKKVEIVKEKLIGGCYLSDHNPVIAYMSF